MKSRLLIDSREQKPLVFKEGSFGEVATEGLPFGDYWCELDGVQVPLVFERKSLPDLFGTLSKGYERFKRELARAKENKFTIILVIEDSMREVAKGHKYSKRKGDSVLKQLAMLRVKHDLEYHFFNDRYESAKFITDIFNAIARNYSREEKENSKTGKAPRNSK